MAIPGKDVLYLASLDCIQTAMKRICEVKGAHYFNLLCEVSLK
jgi:hypothetical protein